MKNKRQTREVIMKELFKKSKLLFSYSLLALIVFSLNWIDLSFSQNNCVKGEVKIGSQGYSSIQSAVDASRQGDVIELGSGVFEENVDIAKKHNLSIQSKCFAEVYRIQARSSNNFHLKAVSIKTPESVAGVALKLINMVNARIENVRMFNSAQRGVSVTGKKSKVLFSKVFVYNNEDQGIILDDGVEVVIRDSLIYGNRQSGVFIKDVSSVIIEDSDIYNNGKNGIITNTDNRKSSSIKGFIGLSAVNVHSNSLDGVGFRSNLSWRISHSIISGNLRDGLDIKKSAVSSLNERDIIEGSLIERNKRYGVFLTSVQGMELIRNEIKESGDYGIFYGNSSEEKAELLLKGNEITNNGGMFSRGLHSKDLHLYNRYLDNEDTGNETSLNSEGLGVGNHRPVAIAGEDVLFSSVGRRLSLSGKDSYDRDGDKLSYSWSVTKKPSGSSAVIQSVGKGVSAVFNPDVLGDYELEFLVSDGRQTSKAKLKVSSKSVRPEAVAGLDKLVSLNDKVMLDAGLSSGQNRSNLSYSWSFIKKPLGSSAQIQNKSSKRASFVVDKSGDYEVELKVSEAGLSKTDPLLLSTINIAPQVEISKPSAPVLSQALSLSAVITDEDLSNKGDEDRKVTYKWSVLSAPSAPSGEDKESVYKFSNTQDKVSSFTALRPGDYILQLLADDGRLYGSDTILLSYGNQAPVAKTGRNIPNAVLSKRVDLSGVGSVDPEGKALTYEWSFQSKPSGSMSVIGEAGESEAFFMPDKEGVYRVVLEVSDGFLSSTDTIKIIVKKPKNQAPSLMKIGNKNVKIGEELSFKLSGSDKDRNDSLSYMVSPLPLYKNMRFNAETGEFFFKPRGHQAGSYKLSFSVLDRLGAVDSEDITIKVKALKKNAKTSLKGRVLEANAMAGSGTEVPLVGVDVRLSVDKNNRYGAMTDSEGYFTIDNIPKGTEYIIQILTAGIVEDGKRKYADFHEQVEVIERAENVITRPFYMPLVDKKGVATLSADKATTLINTGINAKLEVPANVSMLNGMSYTGEISLSEVPKALAPVALPESLKGTATLLTLQPAGLRFTTPVRVSFPNRDNFPAGTETDIYSVNPETGLFEVSGRGRVNADRTLIETISGGITAATWHTNGAPPPPPKCTGDLCEEPDDSDCETCKAGSSVDLLTGVLREEHSLASYRSLNKQRVLTLGYNSQSAKPQKKVISMKRFYPVVNAIPPTISSEIRFQGFDTGKEVVSDSSILSEDEVESFVLKNVLNIPFLKTGIHKIDVIATSNYQVSRFSSSVKNAISVVNYINSPYGRGWSVLNLHRLYIDEQSKDILLVRGNSFKAQFRAVFSQRGVVGSGGGTVALSPIERPPEYVSPRGDYSELKPVISASLSVVAYERRMKDGMLYKFDKEGLLLSEEDERRHAV